MNTSELLNWIEAREKNSLRIELTQYFSDSLQTKVYDGKPDSINLSRQRGAAVRIWKNNKSGFSYTEKLSLDALDQALKIALDHADLADEDPYDRPPESMQNHAQKSESFDPDKLGTNWLLEQTLAGEKILKKSHPQIFNVDHCVLEAATENFKLMTRDGILVDNNRGGLYAVASVLARDSGETVNPDVIRFYPNPSSLNWNEMAAEISEECANRLRPAKLPSETSTIVFHPRAGRTLLKRFESVFSGESVVDGLSLLKDKRGESIATGNVNLIDDATTGLASRPTDAEGTPSQKIHLIENGILKNYLLNNYTAAKLQLPQTGHATREIKIPRQVRPSNFYLAPGQHTGSEILSNLKQTILIIELTGASASPISGDFSFGALGFVYNSGKLMGFVNNFTVAGNFFSLLKNIRDIGSEIFFDPPDLWQSVGSPYLAVEGLSLASAL